jgi:hypothetical protein
MCVAKVLGTALLHVPKYMVNVLGTLGVAGEEILTEDILL